MPVICESGAIQRFGQVGDAFGVLTAIVAAVALLILWRTYVFQRNELENMQKFIQRQTLLNTIFQLCEQYREILANTAVVNPPGDLNNAPLLDKKGKIGLAELISHIIERSTDTEMGNSINDIGAPGSIVEKYMESYAVCFRLLHRVFVIIESYDITEKDKQEYARIPRAILSNIELEAILINCLTRKGKGMKKHIEKYAILNNYHPANLEWKVAKSLCYQYDVNAAFGKDNLFISSFNVS